MMLLASLFTIVPASASTEDVIYEHIDISSAATGKFWVDINSTEEKTKANYSQTGYTDRHYDTDFFVDNSAWEVVAQWPASFNTQYPGSATLSATDTTNPIITSKSGISYKMPSKTSTFANGKESINIIGNKTVEIPIGGNFDKINFLTASGCLGTTASPAKTMTVTVKYAGEEAVATAITNEPILGRTAYNTVGNYVATLSTLGAANGSTSFGTGNGTNKLALYEYSIDVDEEKVVESISISMTLTNPSTLSTLGIPAITGTKTAPVVEPEEKVYSYKTIDISSAATGKFWVNINDSTERAKASYSQTGWTDRHYDTDFFVDNSAWEVVAQWPASFNTQYPATATLSAEDTINPIITSKSGVSYKMPTKTSTFTNGKESINLIRNSAVEIPIGGKFDKINFLTASACLGTTTAPVKTMTVTVKYAGEEAVATAITNEPILGRTAYNTVDNYVATLSTLGANNGAASFGTDNGTNKLALYEYSIDVDEEKVVESISISMTLTDSSKLYTLGIPAITGLEIVPDYARNFTNIDLTSYANGKFYVDHTTEEANYSYTKNDLFIGDRLSTDRSSVTWPFALHDRTEGYPEQSAIITQNSTNTPKITSLKSGVPYQMPTKREGLDAKEAVIFNAYGAGILDNWGTIYTKTINVTGNYTALHFLIGRAGYLDNAHSVYVEVHYTDGTKEKLGTGELVNNSSKRPTGVTVPGSKIDQQNKYSQSFVADLVSGFNTSYKGEPLYSPLNADSHYGAENRISLYEYTLKLNPAKTITKIDFYDGLLGTAGVNKFGSMALVSLTMESASANNLTNGFAAGAATIEEGSCKSTVTAHCEGTALLAIYEGNKLIGVNYADITEANPYTTITIENENIVADGEYTVKAMLWNGADGLSPIAAAVNVNQ